MHQTESQRILIQETHGLQPLETSPLNENFQIEPLLSDPFFEEARKVVVKLVWAIPLCPVMQCLFSMVEALISGHYRSILLSGYGILFFTCPINNIELNNSAKTRQLLYVNQSVPLTRFRTDFTSSVWNFCRTVVPGKTAVFEGCEVSGFLLTLF